MAGPSDARLPMLAERPSEVAEADRPSPAPAERRFWVETWGCQMNVYDSERFAGQLRDLGYAPASDPSEADLILLNTCSVREKAAEKMFSRLGRLRPLKRQNPRLVVGIAGCVAQQEQARILARSDVADFVVGPRAVSALPELVAAAEAGRRPIDVTLRDDRYDELRPIERSVRHRAYVTVIEGCNKSCSFCIVPFTRGAEVSRSLASLLDEVGAAVRSGAVEIELLGQNVNAYRSESADFAELLRAVGRVPGLRRLRFTTSHPRELSDRVIAAMAETPVVANSLHLPVQSGSSAVLKRMHRGYDRERYLSRVARLRTAIPDLALSTDIIVGFPGETAEEFEDTLRLIDEVEFDQVFAFIYSPRPQTRAAELADPVPPAEKQERLQRLFARQDVISRRRNSAMVGRTLEVLVDAESERGEGRLQGRTRDSRIVNFAGVRELVGTFSQVRITRALAHSLQGELLRPLD